MRHHNPRLRQSVLISAAEAGSGAYPKYPTNPRPPSEVVRKALMNKSFCFFFQKEVLFLVLF
jgi:hypothetical protein